MLSDVVIKDDKTIEVLLKEGDSEFITELALAVIPASNDDPAGNPIGTGPFKFVSYTPGQNLILEKYDGYWQKGLPYLDRWNSNSHRMWILRSWSFRQAPSIF